jgi:site-specific DNA recombinase
MKTAIYLRVSTNEQVLEGYGLDAQRSKCLAMAEVKGWEIISEFVDEGISGTKDESGRPGLASLLDAIEAEEVNSVIVSSIDRLGRSTRLVLRMVDNLNGSGVDLVSCKESLDTTTATGRFVLRMFASLAELERDNIVERTTEGRDARGRIDGDRGGRLPMGYERTEKGVIIVEYEAAIVREIFSARKRGLTLVKIAEMLNDRDIMTRRGGMWHASSVRQVLLNDDKYQGGFRGESKERWPVILED